MEYRKDIDGLRAIAVLPVIFFHAGFKSFSGGFLGVDVFFVISGFLITSILLLELQKDKFSIVNFYERRARRILPALFVVLIVTYAVGIVLMPPFEFKEFSQSLVSVVLFISNFFFYMEIDYFSLAAEEMPLLHTWSLAIEEQFYIVFPPMLYLIWKYGAKHILKAFIILALLSLICAIGLNYINNNSASFYWPVSRAWELLAGSICAYLLNKQQLKERKQLANLGFILLIVTMMLWPNGTAHPGLFTIIPVFATCLIILYPNTNSFCYKLLANKFVVFIGLISYSLYLWHQPIFAFVRMKSIHVPELPIIIGALLLTLIASILSYKYVETPFRNKSRFNKKYIFSFSSYALIFFFGLGVFGHISKGVESRFANVKSYADSIQHSPKRKECHATSDNYIHPEQACTYFEDNIEWAVLGDSHAVEPAYALAERLKQDNIGIRHHSFTGCIPALNYQVTGQQACHKWLKDTLQYLEDNKSIKNVLVGFRYSSGIFGDNIATYPLPPMSVALDIESPANLNEQEIPELYWQDLQEIIVRLLASNKNVYLMGPIPELPTHITRATSPFSVFGDSTLIDLEVATSKDYFEQRHSFILKKINSLKNVEDLHLIDVYQLMCNENGCPAVSENFALYFDDDHLSIAGSYLVLERYFKKKSKTSSLSN